jgi:ketosteroid isomerase-like protein
MTNGLLAPLSFLSIIAALVCQPHLSAGGQADTVVAAAAVRKADADWAAAASAANVGGWMSFYAADAIVQLPESQLAGGPQFVRQTVSRLLALPHLSVVLRPVEATLSHSGDLAFLIEAYELRFEDSHGLALTDRGRRLENWRRQADGGWKCIVDMWIADEPSAAPAAPLAQAQLPQPAHVGEAAPARESSQYGDMPTNYEEPIRKYFLEHLKRAQSVQYQEISQPVQGYTSGITGSILMHEKRTYGWIVKATINAQDSHERYVGFKTYTFLFRGETIVDTRSPLPGDEMN